MNEKKQIAIDPDLFAWPSDNPHLIGSKCCNCDNIVFPVARGCPKCGGSSVERVPLKTKGTLWTWTSQGFMPKNLKDNSAKEIFKPYYLGYVELPDQVRVETRLLVDDASQLKIGMPMELEIFTFRVESDGTEIMAYGFKPVSG